MDTKSSLTDSTIPDTMPVRNEADFLAQAALARTALAEFTAVQGFKPETVRASMDELVKATVHLTRIFVKGFN